MRKTGLVWDPLFERHLEHVEHPENAARLRSIYRRLRESGLDHKTIQLPIRPALDEEILLIHTSDYLETVRSKAGAHYEQLDPDTLMTEASFEAALAAAGSGIDLVDAIFDGALDNGFALIRPPGHHARAGHGMGFCIFNNAAIAAEHLVRRHNLERVAIVDFDIHHGNATNESFYERSDVLYCSTHQSPFYPYTGKASEIGHGAGEGYSINIPMEPHTEDDAFFLTYERIILPILESYQPQFLIVSAGYDVHRKDLLGSMNISTECIEALCRLLINAADHYCGGRVAFFLEGGYDYMETLADCVEVTVNALRGTKPNSRPMQCDLSNAAFRDILITARHYLGAHWGCLYDEA